MDVIVAWVCLGGGAFVIVLALVLSMRLQARQPTEGDSRGDLEGRSDAGDI